MTRYRRLFESAKDGIIILSATTGEIQDVNPFLQEMLGYSNTEFLGRHLWEIGCFKDIVANKDAFLKLQQDKYIRYENLPLETKDGRAIWVEFVSNVYEVNGKQVIQCNIRDITERKLADQALRDSDERFKQLADNIDAVFWISSPAHDKLHYVSPAYEKIWGRSCESLYQSPRTWLDAVHPEDREQVCRATMTKLNQGEYDETYRVIRPDGPVRWVRDRAFPIRNAAGEIFRLVGIASDITETRKLEEQYRQSQKMQSIGMLAGGIAHDFNNLITIINGRCQLMIMRDHPDKKIRSELELIYKTGERAAALTHQLLAFSRQQVLEPKVLDLNTICGESDAMFRRLIPEDIAILTMLDPALWPILADPGQIEQVILNLIVNARDAMPNGGKLTIETANVELSDDYSRTHSEVKPGHYAMLAICDTGAGMDASVKAKIFEPFFTTKGIGKGTGLGLATVYGIVKQSNGHIEVYSEVGKGTIFKVYLPKASSVIVPSESHTTLTAATSGSETLLLVEDDNGVRELAKEILELSGYTVLTAIHGGAALKLFMEQKSPIHLLITDVVMPEMGGPELVDRLRMLRPELNVLFTSGYTDRALTQSGTLDASVNFIQKPYTATNLAHKVRQILDSAKVNLI